MCESYNIFQKFCNLYDVKIDDLCHDKQIDNLIEEI